MIIAIIFEGVRCHGNAKCCKIDGTLALGRQGGVNRSLATNQYIIIMIDVSDHDILGRSSRVKNDLASSPNFEWPGLRGRGTREGIGGGTSAPGMPTGLTCGVSASLDLHLADIIFFLSVFIESKYWECWGVSPRSRRCI